MTAQQVKIDSVFPLFTYTRELGADYADSIYEVSIAYPEFIDMAADDVARLQAMTDKPLPAMPAIEQYIGVSRKRGTLYVSFVPLVFREGKYQKLVSFMLKVESRRAARARSMERATSTNTYASHSVLATGRWAKIRVPSTGVYQLTSDLIRKAGFSDISKVKVYGYGGAMQPERLMASYLQQTDDLSEVPTCMVGDRRVFYAIGPVSWSSNTTTSRTRNPYSDYGYYLSGLLKQLTGNFSEQGQVTKEQFEQIYTRKNLYVRLVNEAFKETGKTIDTDSDKLRFRSSGDTTVEADRLSSGEKQLLIILLTALLEDGQEYVLMMDEPEISLHISWQYKLIDWILQLNPNVQLILTTHSPMMFADGWGDKAIHMENITTTQE